MRRSSPPSEPPSISWVASAVSPARRADSSTRSPDCPRPSSTPARRPRAGVGSRSTPSRSGAASTIATASTTPCSSRTTTSRPPAASMPPCAAPSSGTPKGMPVQVEVESEAMADRAVELGCQLPAARQSRPRHDPPHRRAPRAEGPARSLRRHPRRQSSRRYAETGVARISMGALTHSVHVADVALEIDLLPIGGGSRDGRTGGA